jgi:hypothetical protein
MKRRSALALLFLGLAMPALAGDGAVTLNGFLFSKLGALGTRSEGPQYFLQTFDGREIAVAKHTMMWQPDPALQRYIATKVTIEGDMVGNILSYRSIRPYSPSVGDFGR